MGNNCACLNPTESSQEQNKTKTEQKIVETRRKKKSIETPELPKPAVEKEEDESVARMNLSYTDHVLKSLPSLSPFPLGERYALGHELGRGEFGITRLCIDRETGESLACKSVPKARLRTAVDVDDVRREVAIVSSLPAHPNVVRLRSAHEDARDVHLVMELCEGGELFDRIVARGSYGERAAAGVARAVAEAVRFLHENRVMHRDLKPENFLFANGKESAPLKVIDFGLSVFFRPGEKFLEVVGSPYYMAPEVLKRSYGPEIDVWSAGVILYILFTGTPPFWDETEQGVARAILRGEIDFQREPWPQVSEDAKSLIRQMLEPDPKRRLTAQEVLEHRWLQNTKSASNIPMGDIVKARLKQFSLMNRFKKTALQVIAENLSVEEVQVIRDQFKQMDRNNNGRISFEELKTGLQEFASQLGETQVKMLMEAADVDGSGVLDYGEFVAIIINLEEKIVNDDNLRTAFMFFDLDGSGYIEIHELRDALKGDSGELEDEVLNEIMREVDTDKDGRISYEEFVTMMKAGTDRRGTSCSSERFKCLTFSPMNADSLSMDEETLGRFV